MIGRRLFSSHRPHRRGPCIPPRSFTVSLALGLILALAACSPSSPRDYEGHGKAVDIDLATRTVTLDHGDIPDLMKGMTMTFAVAADVDLETLAPGSEVDFRLTDEAGALTVTRIRPVAP